jgi:hypothetical protein
LTAGECVREKERERPYVRQFEANLDAAGWVWDAALRWQADLI